MQLLLFHYYVKYFFYIIQLASKENNTAQVNDDEISLKDLILKIREWYRYLLTKWKVILLAGIIGAASGFAYAYLKKPMYTATCTFVLEAGKSSSGLSQYAGLAAVAGINLGGASNGLFQGDNIMELYKSRTMLQKTLLSYGEFDGKRDLLINRYIKINKLREGWAKSKNPYLQKLSFNMPVEKFTRLNDSVMTMIIRDINKNYLRVSKPDKALTVIGVEVKSEDEQFAKEFDDRVVETVNLFYVESKMKKQNGNINVLRHQADSVRRMLNAAIGGTAAFLDANPNANPALQILHVPSQRKQVDVQANTAIYAEIVKNMEMAKMAAMQDAPLIQIVDTSIYPLPKDKVGKIKGVTLGGLIFGFLTLCGLLIIKGVNDLVG